MVPGGGLEPPRPYKGQRILSPLRLPFRHPGQTFKFVILDLPIID